MELLQSIISRLPQNVVHSVSRAQWRNPLFKQAFEFIADRLRNRDGVISAGIGQGLRFNAGRSHAGYMLGTSEARVQRALAQILRPGMTFYDVGANVGFHSTIAARLVGASGNVVSFEPVAENAHAIRHNAELNQFAHVRVLEVALSDIDEIGDFRTSEESSWGALARSGNEPDRCSGSIQVPVRRLDEVREDETLSPPDLMKIDVEGAEVAVLRGANRTIGKHKPLLLIELHGTNAAISEYLTTVRYRGVVLGSSTAINDSSWDAYVVAVPAERSDMLATFPFLSEASFDCK
jgi:FkbM family methyltransferase